ncbi:MAG: 2,3,4,5-tetrahydropyridine-2,6-carboxylate N-succinyltransferase [Alphaproteobacteria bacterium HGW-Alphaproteobacteria-2]|nr:MAG: 2,3,4,5-tetrahydropyridine-2,6-carboxylate N-succinyltransferase [Alphaproteobacteria bacterium HGW-Alphaproteobacteria-2]
MVRGQELVYNTNATAMQMANEIFGDGVTVVSATYTGDSRSSAIYSRGDNLSPDATPSDTGVILSTGLAADFTNRTGNANQNAGTSTNTSGPNNDPNFNALAGTSTFDASFLTVNFIPQGDTLTMQFVFASEEYPEFVNSVFQDVVGVWVNGQPVQLSVGDGTVDPSSINTTNNQNLFVDNTGSNFNTEMDGFTVTLTLKAQVIPGQVNTIKIGIADVSDSNFDSSLLIAGGSMQTAFIASDDSVTLAPGASKTIDVLGNDTAANPATLTITHINGQAVGAGSTVTLSTGQQITLNADGTFTILGDADTETVSFTYTAVANGISDTAFVTINQVPCFVRGTRIETPGGEVAVEALAVGDLVNTLDDGPRPVRWVGRRRVAAEGRFAPVRIREGALGVRRDLWVSPQQVDYFHLLFDNHQVIRAEGLETESFLPGPQIQSMFEAEVLEELVALFPELDPATGQGYGAASRPTLRGFEAGVLSARLS